MSLVFNRNNTLACIGGINSLFGLGWLLGTQGLAEQLGLGNLTNFEAFGLRNFGLCWHGLTAYLCYVARKSKSEEFKEQLLRALFIIGGLLTMHLQYAQFTGLFKQRVPFFIMQALNVSILGWIGGAICNCE